MIGRKKAVALFALAAVVAVPTVGMARQHYTGTLPPSMSAVEPVTTSIVAVKTAHKLTATKLAPAKKVTIKSKHKKHKKHKKVAAKK